MPLYTEPRSMTGNSMAECAEVAIEDSTHFDHVSRVRPWWKYAMTPASKGEGIQLGTCRP